MAMNVTQGTENAVEEAGNDHEYDNNNNGVGRFKCCNERCSVKKLILILVALAVVVVVVVVVAVYVDGGEVFKGLNAAGRGGGGGRL